MYDFANSAFATTMLSVVFNVYFVQRVVPPEGVFIFGRQVPGAALWGYIASLSMLVTFMFTPFLGTLADQAGKKKFFLVLHWLPGCLACAALAGARPGRVWFAAAFFAVANIGFAGANIFYNAFLPQLGPQRTLGRVSGLGWALGYVGGGLCLALNLWMIRQPAFFGLPAGDAAVRATFFSVGVWWFVFALPFLLWVKEVPSSVPGSWTRKAMDAGLGLWHTLRHLGQYRNLMRYLLAYLPFNEGINTIILMASIFGAQALGMAQDQLILCFLMIQAVAFFGSLLFGWLADRINHKRTLYVTLAIYVFVLLWGYALETVREFWLLSFVVGLVLGGSQSASRSLTALLVPPEKSAEFFSFFGLAGKLTNVAGPLVFALSSQLWGLRAGVLSLLVFFLLGGILLWFVEEPPRFISPDH